MGIDNRKINCKFCGNPLGEIRDDAQIFRMGKAAVYHRTRIFCSCGWSFVWIPAAVPDEVLSEQQQEFASTIKNNLAKKPQQAETNYE